MATEQETYNIGFTAGAAMLNEMRAVAEAFLDCGGDLVSFLNATSLILVQWHCGMKRPGPTLHVRLRETGSTDRHAHRA